MVDPFMTRFNPPFPLAAPPVFWLVNPFTDYLVEQMRRQKRFSDLAVTVVDLLGRTRMDGSGWMTVAGWRMYEERVAGSMLKICVLFASFMLRRHLRLAMNEVGSNDLDEVLLTIGNDWKEAVETAVPAGRPDFPNFKRIFQFSGGIGSWNMRFSDYYWKHMINMIQHSDNHSSSLCINEIGFQYINGALAAEGLWSDSFGGLWLGSNYAGRNWMKEPLTNKTHVGATAKAVAAYLSLVEDSRLVGSAESEQMRKILALAGTWFGEGLVKARRTPSIIYGKVGIVTTFSDCAVVERSDKGRLLRYAAVCLGATNPQQIRDLAVALDDYIKADAPIEFA